MRPSCNGLLQSVCYELGIGSLAKFSKCFFTVEGFSVHGVRALSGAGRARGAMAFKTQAAQTSASQSRFSPKD